MAPSLAVLAIVEVFCESLLYVFNRKGEIKVILLVVSLALFTCITIHEVVDAGRLIWVFSTHATVAEVDAWYAAGLTKVWNLLNNSAYVAETIVSDLFLVFPPHYLYNDPKLHAGAGLALPISLSNFKGSNLVNPSFVNKQETIDTTFFSSTFALNAMCTGLIAYRILHNSQFKSGTGSTRLSKVAVVVIESESAGAIYLVSLAFLLSTYVRKSTLNYVFLDIGIVFSLIIVRVGLNISYEASSRGPTVPTLRFNNATTFERGTVNHSTFGTTTNHGTDTNSSQHVIEPQCSSGTLRDSKRVEVGVVDVYEDPEKVV
ncbi:hypothetical protein K488DRAFT_71143 [Vararia minispora EC-137]|uniref:Uncharacterized protein n=1 Tax=Vararia minispora EC-137 TaxID=1314806 RepID=A0ACB8QIX7_9AGAM|nr:hypothetical protein K488DRAFT_71143 [Vararia minispora EC-137]